MTLKSRTKHRIERFIRDAVGTPEVGVFGCYAGNDRIIVRLPMGLRLTVFASDLSITPELVTQGMYDWHFWNFIRKHVRPGDRAIDVGANVGLFTVAMAHAVGDDGEVLAYEPDPDLAQVVRDNLMTNWLSHRATVVEAAVADSTGVTTFMRHPRLRALSSAGTTDMSAHTATEGYEQLSVPVERLDQRASGHYRLIKIDVEGGEIAVLRGFSGVDADFLDIEVLRNTQRDWDEFVEVLKSLPGTPHILSDDGEMHPSRLSHVVDVAKFSHVVFA